MEGIKVTGTLYGRIVVEVPSKRNPGRPHKIYVDPVDNSAVHSLGDDCPGFENRGACRHLEEARGAAEKYVKAAQWLVNSAIDLAPVIERIAKAREERGSAMVNATAHEPNPEPPQAPEPAREERPVRIGTYTPPEECSKSNGNHAHAFAAAGPSDPEDLRLSSMGRGGGQPHDPSPVV